jgi:hypothetical protein
MSGGHGSHFIPERYVLVEFPTGDALLEGTRKLRERGHRDLDTHTPYPLHGIEDALGLARARIPKIVFAGGLAGAIIAYSMMYFMNVIDFPINVANRPPHSAPAFVPITFELTILLGGGSAFFGLMALMGLPKPYHPLFESESFRRASIDGFFLSIRVPTGESADTIAAEARNVGAANVEIVEEAER